MDRSRSQRCKKADVQSAQRSLFASKINIINRLAIWLIHGIRPLLGPQNCCKFYISCGRYAIMQLKEQNIAVASWRIVRRLIACRPF